MDHYMEWVEASSLAYRVKSWATPVRVFGYVVLGLAAAMLVTGLLGGVASLATYPQAALGAVVVSIVASAVLFLQGSVVLMVATYIQMRAQQTIAQTSQVLASDDEAASE